MRSATLSAPQRASVVLICSFLGCNAQPPAEPPAVVASPENRAPVTNAPENPASEEKAKDDPAGAQVAAAPSNREDPISTAHAPEPEEEFHPQTPAREPEPPLYATAVTMTPAKFWHEGPIYHMPFAADSKSLLTIDGKELVRWRVPDGEVIERLRLEFPTWQDWLDFSADLTVGVARTYNRQNQTRVRVWNLQTGKQQIAFWRFAAQVTQAALSPDKNRLATVEGSPAPPVIRIWDLQSGDLLSTCEQLQSPVSALAFAADGQSLLASCTDGTLRHWDCATGEVIDQHAIDEHGVARFSPDGKLLALTAAKPSRWLRLYDTTTGLQSTLLRPLPSDMWEFFDRRSNVRQFHFTADGETLIALTEGGRIARWDTKTGVLVLPPIIAASSMEVSPDGQYIATTNAQQVLLWEASSGKLLTPPPVIRTMLRPVVVRTAAEDPVSVAIHWAPLESKGHVYTEPWRLPPFDLELLAGETLSSLVFHITAPDGARNQLRSDVKSAEEKPVVFYNEPTFFLTLDRDGLSTQHQHAALRGRWRGDERPRFSLPGAYKLKIAGTVFLSRGESIPFETGEVVIDRAFPGYRPLDDLRGVALAKLKQLLPADEDSFKDMTILESGRPVGVIEVEGFDRLVGFRIHRPVWNAEEYLVRMKPDGVVQRIDTWTRFTCLAQGTKIATPQGPRAIETILVGDQVVGYDFTQRRKVVATVRNVLPSHARRTLWLGSSLRVTPEHPVYADGQWKPAGDIRPGETLLMETGEPAPVGEPRFADEPIAVYDLSVDPPHNFFAGGVLVHNKSMGYGVGAFDPWRTFLLSPPKLSPPKESKQIWPK